MSREHANQILRIHFNSTKALTESDKEILRQYLSDYAREQLRNSTALDTITRLSNDRSLLAFIQRIATKEEIKYEKVFNWFGRAVGDRAVSKTVSIPVEKDVPSFSEQFISSSVLRHIENEGSRIHLLNIERGVRSAIFELEKKAHATIRFGPNWSDHYEGAYISSYSFHITIDRYGIRDGNRYFSSAQEYIAWKTRLLQTSR